MDSEKIAPDIEAENVIEVQEMEMEQVEMNKEIQSKLQITNIWGVIAHNLFPITYGAYRSYLRSYIGDLFEFPFGKMTTKWGKSGQNLGAKSYSE